MTKFPSVARRGRSSLKSAGAVSLTIVGLAAAGCSADVTRFDSASFSFNDPPQTGSTPVPSEPLHAGAISDNVSNSTPRGPYGAGASSVEVAALPDAGPAGQSPSYAPSPQTTPYQAAPSKPFGQPRREAAASPAAAPAQSAAAKGEMIEVQQGDTLYGLSKRHHVALSELMSLNNLSSPSLKPGQKLYLPAGAGSAGSRSQAQAAAKAVEAATPAPAPLTPAPPEVVARYGASYTVKPGDSLYSIARAHKVKFSELQQVNGISDPRKVKPGAVIKVPGEASSPAVASSEPSPPSDVSSEPHTLGQATTTQPTVINGDRRVAALNDKATDAAPEAPAQSAPAPSQPALAKEQSKDKVAVAAPTGAAEASDSVKLRWPVSGKIIAGFGGRPDGTHNDGVNLSVPLGTEVHAAENGVVAYAGNELKGYGNLVLLRHDNGWVTAYAHNDELLVKRGDKVKRGQVIAKAGKTGSVDQPQVHFEVRQGSRPVDPVPYLEKL